MAISDKTLRLLIDWVEGESGPPEAWEIEGLAIPPEFKRISGPLYRGMGLRKWDYQELKKIGHPKALRIESWSTDEGTAGRFAFGTIEPYKVVLRYTPSPKEILVNLGALFSNEKIWTRAKKLDPQKMAYIEELDESEVLLIAPKFRNKVYIKKLSQKISGSIQEFEYGDYTLLHSMRKYNEQGTTWDEHTIKAFDSQKQEVGKYSFQQHILDGKDILIEDNVYTKPQAQKQGLATQAYLLIEKITGLKIRPNGQFRKDGKWEVSHYHQSDQARNLWRSRNGKWGIPDSEMVQEATALGATIVRIQVGAGSAKLVRWDYNSFYEGITDDLTESLTYEADDYLFLEALSNGGEKGAGLKVLKRALERARRDGAILAVVVMSKDSAGQDKLRDWYLDTGLLEQVPTQRGTWFQNIFVDKQADLTLK